MGNDGGSIPTRREILNYNTQELSKLKDISASNSDLAYSKQSNAWDHCKLSFERIFTSARDPVVSDYRGNLYLKEKVIEYLLSRDSKPDFEHLKSIRDIVQLKVKYDKKNRILCPLSSIIIDVDDKKIPSFVYIVPCGCVMGKKILYELVKSKASKKGDEKKLESGKVSDSLIEVDMECPVCQEKFNSLNIIEINPTDMKVLNILEARLQKLKEKGLSHALKPLKKEKKSKKRKSDDNEKIELKKIKI